MRAETYYSKLVVLHPVGYAGYIVHSHAFGAQNVDALFFMLMWAWYRFDEERTRTSYAEFVFLHPVGSAGHVVQSGASRA
jgi:hypothetical protein